MFVQILGSAAGGGFPQWNCNCVNCAGFRNGSLNAKARTQSSIAISDDGVNWILCNASPDIRVQLQGFTPLQPGRALRDTGISAIIDAHGRVTARAPQFVATALSGTFVPRQGATPYTRLRDRPVLALALVMLAWALWRGRAVRR